MIQRHEKSAFAVTLMCRLLSVSCSGYYGWRKRAPSVRQQADQALIADLHRLHGAHKARIGAPRMVQHLREDGQTVGRVRVARLMRQEGLRRSEEHTSELQSLMRISYAVFCLKKKNNI